MSIKSFYKTQSLSLAAAIQTVSTAKLERVLQTDQLNRATFVFDKNKDPNFDEIVSRFWAHQLPFDLATYFDNLRFIKNRLHEVLDDRSRGG